MKKTAKKIHSFYCPFHTFMYFCNRKHFSYTEKDSFSQQFRLFAQPPEIFSSTRNSGNAEVFPFQGSRTRQRSLVFTWYVRDTSLRRRNIRLCISQIISILNKKNVVQTSLRWIVLHNIFLWETNFFAVFVFCMCPFHYICTEYHFSFGENAGFARHIPYQNFPFYNDLMTRLFALSTTEVSSDAR